MVFEYKIENAFHHIPNLGKLGVGPTNVNFADIYGTPKGQENPLTGSMFLLEPTPTPEPAPTYNYDESGVVLRGDLTIKDETGKSVTLGPGDTFFIRRGSTITFSTERYALAYKMAARFPEEVFMSA